MKEQIAIMRIHETETLLENRSITIFRAPTLHSERCSDEILVHCTKDGLGCLKSPVKRTETSQYIDTRNYIKENV